MQTASNTQRQYTGPLGRAIASQQASPVVQLASLSTTPIQYGPLATARRVAAAQQEAVLRSMRVNIMEMMVAPLFTPAEQLRANDSVYQTTCIAKLQTWFRNVYRVYKERETALTMAFEDGTYCHLPVAQPAESFMWIA